MGTVKRRKYLVFLYRNVILHAATKTYRLKKERDEKNTKMWLVTIRHAHLEVTVYHDLSERTKPAVPKLSRWTTPLVSQPIFHGAPRSKEIPHIPVY
jgi:hypothetical protein